MAVMSNAAVNTVHKHLLVLESLLSVLLGVYLEVGWLDHGETLFLHFKKPLPSMLFSMAAALFCVCTNRAQGFQFPHILTNTFFHFVCLSVCLPLMVGVLTGVRWPPLMLWRKQWFSPLVCWGQSLFHVFGCGAQSGWFLHPLDQTHKA